MRKDNGKCLQTKQNIYSNKKKVPFHHNKRVNIYLPIEVYDWEINAHFFLFYYYFVEQIHQRPMSQVKNNYMLTCDIVRLTIYSDCAIANNLYKYKIAFQFPIYYAHKFAAFSLPLPSFIRFVCGLKRLIEFCH